MGLVEERRLLWPRRELHFDSNKSGVELAALQFGSNLGDAKCPSVK